MLDKPLPHAKEIEKAIINEILATPASFYNCKQILTKECFYNDKYAKIWGIIEDLHNRGLSADITTLIQILTDLNEFDKLGGMKFFIELMEQTTYFPNFANDINLYCAMVKDKYVRRMLITENYKLIQAAYDESKEVRTSIKESTVLLSNALNTSTSSQNSESYTSIAQALVREISDNLGMFQEITGVPTGFESFDKRLGGFSFEGDLHIIAARPAMGKTTFAINCAYNAYRHFNFSGVFFSLEMSKKQIVRKIISKEHSVTTDDLKKNKLNEFQVSTIFDDVMFTGTSELIINDTPNADIHYIVSECHRLKEKHDIKFVYIDYMQLISCKAMQNRELEISYISRKLKELAATLKIPVIALAQLSRAVETRGGSKRPQLSDLRESGSMEQDAAVVTFLWRPEYYGILEDAEGHSLKNVSVAITAKNRHGEIGDDYMFFDGATSVFCDYDYVRDRKIPVESYNKDLLKMQNLNNHVQDFKSKIEQSEFDLF